ASGRMTARVLPFAEQLAVPLSLVSYNGAELLEGGPAAWTSVSLRGLSAAARDAVFDLCRSQRVFLNVYAAGKLHGYHPEGDFAWSRHYEANSGAVYAGKHTSLESLPLEGIPKLLVMETFANRERLYDAWSPLLSNHCVLTKSNPEYLEFLAKGVSKGSGLEIWLERNDILPSELLAFGDAENDLEMLRLAGMGIAMANATPGLRAAYSRFSRWSHAEEGVAKEIAALFGLPENS
ncbi:MAG TPA: HAD hydrolase family protein, partial [Fibrobacteria bacterium]|nr:HAD hydrolase family protein [Fibrobacteria bacterium]